MKRYGGLTLVVAAVLVSVSLLAKPGKAEAAACANTSSYGAVRLTLPDLPRTGDYAVWVRVQSPDATAKVLVEVNQDNCLEVASTTLTPNQWSWVAYRSNGSIGTVDMSSSKNNSLRLIGIQQGVKVDRVVLTKPDCTPEEFGNNCSELTEASLDSNSDVQSVPPPSAQPVSGKVILSNTPTLNQADLASVSYTVNGVTVQTSTGPSPFDTTLVADGKYTVFIETTLNSGKVIRESTVIEVDNPTNPLSPLIRWLRINQRSLLVIVGTAGALLATAILLGLFRRWYLKRRERHFHGF